jgi:Domain of unknown function (DUF6438)
MSTNRSAPTRLYSAVKAVLAAAGVIGAPVVGSCHGAPLTRPESAVPKSIALERMPCFGACPAYRVSVEGTGRISFVSRNSYDDGRTANGVVASSVLDSLYARAVRVDFFAFPDTLVGNPPFCDSYATDSPTATVTINTNAGKKSVVDYHGCFAKSPAAQAKLRELRAFEDAIDTLTGSSRWIQPNRR